MTVEQLIKALRKIENDQMIVIALDRTTGDSYAIEGTKETDGVISLLIDVEE